MFLPNEVHHTLHRSTAAAPLSAAGRMVDMVHRRQRLAGHDLHKHDDRQKMDLPSGKLTYLCTVTIF